MEIYIIHVVQFFIVEEYNYSNIYNYIQYYTPTLYCIPQSVNIYYFVILHPTWLNSYINTHFAFEDFLDLNNTACSLA